MLPDTAEALNSFVDSWHSKLKSPELGNDTLKQAPHFDGHQKAVGVIGVCRDITDLRHAQEQASLHVEQLARAMRISTMGEMATGMAHEINQPLEAIANSS